MQPVERERDHSAEGGLNTNPQQFITSGAQHPVEVAPRSALREVAAYRAPCTDYAGDLPDRSLTDLPPMLLLAGNVGLQCVDGSFGEGGLLLRAGGRRRFRQGPLGRAHQSDAPH
jgi:hypothetical protein